MKVKVKIIEEKTFEIDLEPKTYLYARACFKTNNSFHDLLLTEGKIIDCSRSWESVDTEDTKALEKFFEKNYR